MTEEYRGIKILYEDNHLIVAVKPAGVLSQSDGTDSPDMLTLLKEYIKIRYSKPGNVFLGLVHRLDRNVSGVMVFAKTSKGASRLSEQIRNHNFEKRYLAIVGGKPSSEEGTLVNFLLKDSVNNVEKVFDEKKHPSEAKRCSLSYRVLKTGEYKGKAISLVDIKLDSGRSHQIRAQLSHMGNPILGDKKYGDRLYSGDVALKSYRLGFKHPTTSEPMEFTDFGSEKAPWSFLTLPK